MLEWIFQSARIMLAEAVQVSETVVETAAEASAEVTPAIEAVATQAVSTQASTPFDWSLLIAIAALVFSIASPVASALITGMYQLKQKELEYRNALQIRNQEFYYQHRAEVVERFLRTAGAVINGNSYENRTAFGETIAEMYLYVPEKHWFYLHTIDANIENDDRDSAMSALTSLASALSEEHIRFERHEEPKKANKKHIDKVAAE